MTKISSIILIIKFEILILDIKSETESVIASIGPKQGTKHYFNQELLIMPRCEFNTVKF